MKFGIKKPSIKGRISARTSPKRYARQSLGLKAPKGMGIITDPKRAVYNKIYRKTTFGCMTIPIALLFFLLIAGCASTPANSTPKATPTITPIAGLLPGIAPFLEQHPEFGKFQSKKDQPDWMKGKRQTIITNKGTYLFYMDGENVMTVYLEGNNGRELAWGDYANY